MTTKTKTTRKQPKVSDASKAAFKAWATRRGNARKAKRGKVKR